MIWVAFLPFLMPCVVANRTLDPVPFFHGHVFENSSPGSRVNGLSVPLKRLNSHRLCGSGEPGSAAAHFKLLGDGSEDFRVFAHHKRGHVLLKTTQTLDREERAEYALGLGLCCGQCAVGPCAGEDASELVASIKVDVLDTNDHQPVFPSTDMKLDLDDATALRAAICSLSARDGDSGKNAELFYFAVPKNGSFYAVPKTGDILLVDSILGLEEPIKFQVFARDRGWPPRTSQSVSVEINPRQWPAAHSPSPKQTQQVQAQARKSRSVPDPEKPVFISVSEDAGIGSVVVNLNPVRFQSATFELVEPQLESCPVSVSRDSGDVVIMRRLDRETQPLVEITVRVQDKRPEWYLVRVELTVTDVNDNVPEWNMVPAPYLAVVSPDATAGSLVYKLNAQDGDEGLNGDVEYFLSDGDGRFEVDRKNGQIRTTGLPLQRDREYLLTVVAADGLGSRSAPAIISVVAGARPPQFTNASYTIAIPENTPEGQFLVTPAVSFQKKPISYSLVINPSSLFSILAETGEISLTRTIDYETDQHRHLLLVRASEGQNSMSSATEVRVFIVDENDCVPEFLQSIYSKDGVPETVTTATSLLQSANDCDSGANADLTYYTLSPDFIISPHGTIFPAGPLDYERPNHLYEFVVMAIDKGEVPRTGTTTVRIRMANVNDEAPEFSQHYRTFVSEDAGPNTLVATVLAKDPDGDGITYKINTGNDEGNFVIDSQKLIRLRSSPPPRLQGVEYVLNVTATDDNASGGPQALSSTAQVIVGVDDVNNNKPVFEKPQCQQYRESTSVLENQPAGTFVLQVHAVDADEGSNGRVTYGFMHKDSTVPAFSIHPDTVIVTARKFDRERQREYAVTVTATDQAADPLIGICQLNILILDQNDNSPKFKNLRYEFLREDTMIGTSFLRVAAHDDDFGTNAAITYSMSGEQPEYLRVNPLTGWVYVNQPISQRTYITREIVATDGGNRSSSVELAVTITNVKNQPPQWQNDTYSVVIPENTVRDTPIVISYSLLEDRSGDHLYFQIDSEQGFIYSQAVFDRETKSSYLLEVQSVDGWESARPGKHGQPNSTAYVRVFISDVNDNKPVFAQASYEVDVDEDADVGFAVLTVSANDGDERMPTTVLGKVYAPDPDDWDNKTFVFEGHMPYFILNKRTGFLIIKENTPPGTYQFQVRVSDGIWPDAVSTVTVHVRELREEAIFNSASLRLADITAKEFLELRGKQRSRYDLLVDFLSEMLSVPPDEVNIFSLMDVKERMLDVRFAVNGGPSFLQPEKMHGYLAAHKQKLQSFLQVSVFQVRVDECPGSECAGTAGCTNVLNVRDAPMVVDCGTMSLVSVMVESKAVCSCPGREQSHQPCASYPRNPCFNGGVCVDTQHGYCQCPAQFEGPECQQNKHSFHGNGYAWFPPMMPCFESHVSLEFITDVADGLLLYSGPLAQLQAWDHEDFMAILIDGTPTLKINHGSGTLVLQLPGDIDVADRRWHRLDVRSNSKEVRFTLDRCAGAAVKEMEGLASWLTTEDHSSCEVMGVTPNADHLNMSQVLQLGGVNEDIPYIYPQLQHKHFTGCIRNLVVDSKLYDLGSPADWQSSSPGCLTTDSSCVNMGYPSCGHRGRCHGEWGSFSCQCVAGYAGHQCEKVPEYSFDGHSHVHYKLASSLPARRTWIQVLLRTRKHSSIIVSLVSRDQSEYLRIEGLLCIFYNLGDGDYNLTLPSYRLDNGEWHEVFLDRHDNEMTLRLDGGGGKREVTGSQGRSREIIINSTAVMLGNSFPSQINKSFQCIRDLRLNGRYMPLDSQPRDGVSQVSVQGLSVGCSSDSCKKNHCKPPFTCVDLWRVHECCPPGHMIRVNGTKKSCVYTLCATRPCHRGTCVAQSPSKFTCHCLEGYRGRHCETTLAIYREDVGLSFSSLFAICICFMALLLLLGIFLYTRWRTYKGLKEGVYHVSAHHDGWEDIRENVLNYDEEGGGEEDQNAYDMAELQKSLQPSPAQSVQYCRSRALHHPPPPHHHHHHHLLHQAPPAPPPAQPVDALSRTSSSTTLPPSTASTSSTATTTVCLRRDVPPTRPPAQGQARPSQLARRSLSFSSQDLARYLCEIIRDADQHPDTGPFDSLQVFSTEGGGSPAGSLSSFSSAGLDGGSTGEGGGEARREETLGEWGPRFEKLRALYERAEASDL
uniref:Si:ch211-186j3.6 n=1 Tax=Fundulus heteroclitus TaxID=8078 RepID=A0A3Q2PU85_FUNHE